MSITALVLLAILGTFRAARLVAWDVIFQPLRSNLGRRAASGSKFWHFVAELAHCPYCLGVWFAAGFAALITLMVAPFYFLFLWLGIAGAQFILQNITED